MNDYLVSPRPFIPTIIVLAPPPFPGFNPREEAERRGFTRPLPAPPRP